MMCKMFTTQWDSKNDLINQIIIPILITKLQQKKIIIKYLLLPFLLTLIKFEETKWDQ